MISRIAIPSGAHPWNIVYMVAEIADRDSGFCPGRQVKRLTYEPGQIQIREKPMKQI